MAYDELIDRIRIMHKACMHERTVETELRQIGNLEWQSAIRVAVQHIGEAGEADWQVVGTQMGRAIRALEELRPGPDKPERLRDLLRAIESAREEVRKLQAVVPCPSVLAWPGEEPEIPPPTASQVAAAMPDQDGRVLRKFECGGHTLRMLVDPAMPTPPAGLTAELRSRPDIPGTSVNWGGRVFMLQATPDGPTWAERAKVEESREWRPFTWQDEDQPRQASVRLWPGRPLSEAIQALLTKKRELDPGFAVRQGDRQFIREENDPQGYPRWTEICPLRGKRVTVSGPGAPGGLDVSVEVDPLDDTPLTPGLTTLLLGGCGRTVNEVVRGDGRSFRLSHLMRGGHGNDQVEIIAKWEELKTLTIRGGDAAGQPVTAEVQPMTGELLPEEIRALLLRNSHEQVGTERRTMGRRFRMTRKTLVTATPDGPKSVPTWTELPYEPDQVAELPPIFSAWAPEVCPQCNTELRSPAGKSATLHWKTKMAGGYAGATESGMVVEAGGPEDPHLFVETPQHRIECRKCGRNAPFIPTARYVRT